MNLSIRVALKEQLRLLAAQSRKADPKKLAELTHEMIEIADRLEQSEKQDVERHHAT